MDAESLLALKYPPDLVLEKLEVSIMLCYAEYTILARNEAHEM